MFNIGDFAGQFADDGFTYVPIGDLIDMKFTIDSFKLFTSKDTEKYNSGNERGVMLNIIVEDMDNAHVKTTTHSKVLVSVFEEVKNKKASIPKDTVFMICRVESESGGRKYFTIRQITFDKSEN